MTDKKLLATALADCGRHTDRIEELTTAQLVRITGAPDIDRISAVTALEAIVLEVKALRVRLQTLRLELPIH